MSSVPSEQAWSTVDAALRAARALNRMETACFVVVSATTTSYLRVTGAFADLGEGTHYPRADSIIARMLDGAPTAAAGVGPGHPAADTAEHRLLGVRSYLAMPVIPPDGRLLGFLVGLDRDEVAVSADILALVRAIADALAATGDIPAPSPPAVSLNGPRPGDHREAAVDPGNGGNGGHTSVEPPGNGSAASGDATRDGDGSGSPGGEAAQEAATASPPPSSGVPSAPEGATPGPEDRPEPAPATSAASAIPAAPRPPGRVPSPQTVARVGRPGPPGRAGPPRPTPPPVVPGGGTGPVGTGGARPAPAVPRRSTADMRLRRTPAGWVVEGPGPEVRPVGDLISAMVLADLLAEDLAPPGRPRRAERDLGEIEQLRLSVVQLEHALASRVIVEQAIGVLAERNQIRPREAFERLRRTARGMGRRVHDLARQVVDSVGDPRAVLPGELGGRGGPAGAGPAGSGSPAGSSGPAGATPESGGAPRPTPPRSTSGRH
ncbi:ANTAR domain-containing protein [Frankia gtarii]|uniref:ANTAR domain-containing protein n=1 Tax=Frankia gtarii TaxID=2950102 RepID=UPI0021C21E77|nr:ANTAR domain-containing protein [Frankia gtarii]